MPLGGLYIRRCVLSRHRPLATHQIHSYLPEEVHMQHVQQVIWPEG